MTDKCYIVQCELTQVIPLPSDGNAHRVIGLHVSVVGKEPGFYTLHAITPGSDQVFVISGPRHAKPDQDIDLACDLADIPEGMHLQITSSGPTLSGTIHVVGPS